MEVGRSVTDTETETVITMRIPKYDVQRTAAHSLWTIRLPFLTRGNNAIMKQHTAFNHEGMTQRITIIIVSTIQMGFPHTFMPYPMTDVMEGGLLLWKQ